MIWTTFGVSIKMTIQLHNKQCTRAKTWHIGEIDDNFCSLTTNWRLANGNVFISHDTLHTHS